jgi:hypothetical protein
LPTPALAIRFEHSSYLDEFHTMGSFELLARRSIWRSQTPTEDETKRKFGVEGIAVDGDGYVSQLAMTCVS